MKFTKVLSVTLLLSLSMIVFSSCDMIGNKSEPEDGSVKLQFNTLSSSSSSKAVSSAKTTASSHDSLIIEGTNGTLRINDIRFIVAEFELDPSDVDEDSTEIEEFESNPFFVDLPLGEDTLGLANSDIQAGFYEELEFEVENLDFDEEEEDAEHQALADSIRSEFADWPNEASMVLLGTFTPSDGDQKSFKVFAEAEIEVELEFDPPLEVTEDNMQQVVLIQINPARWFERSDGTVLDLTDYDWDQHQQLLEFEAEFENGVEKIEVDEEEKDDDDE